MSGTSQDKTEWASVELNLKILDGTVLQSPTACQITFPALPVFAGHVPWS